MKRFTATILTVLGIFGSPAFGADNISSRLRLADEDLKVVSARMDRLQREYEQRRGLIGAEDALQRYEDAVYGFLIGDYERAALTFYTLVESSALTTDVLAQDSEWYLGECVFELKNWNTALAVYQGIVQKGPSHPFFADAVRRSMEVYGILGDTEKFYATYRTYILSGKVPATDTIRYTVAKSFWRQGEKARAKAMFTEIPADSMEYARARYFTGTILASEGQYADALAEFERALQAKPSAEIAELAHLAVGRLNYEMGNYGAAVAAYQKIDASSEYFGDQLYELVWTHIKQESWADALDAVEIFLVAFPDHKYTLPMRLFQGHLNRKATEFEKALTSYESVVTGYEPLHQTLLTMERDREKPAEFFTRLVDSQGIADKEGQIPLYAVEMLVADPEMERALGSSLDLRRQSENIEASRDMVADIKSVLQAGADTIGTFARGRAGLRRVHDDSVNLRAKLLDAEIAQLEAGVDPGAKADVDRARQRLLGITIEADAVQGADSDRTERYQAHEDQVLAVQQLALRLEMELVELGANLEASRRLLEQKKNQLDAGALAEAQRHVDELSQAIPEMKRKTDRLRSDATRRAVMATVPRSSTGDTDARRSELGKMLDTLHYDVRGLRAKATTPDAPVTFSKVDEAWLALTDLDARADRTLLALEKAEVTEVALLKEELKRLEGRIGELEGTAGKVDANATKLGIDITQAGFGDLERTVYHTIMEADMGIVDVYWLRRTEVVEERVRLKTERAQTLSELEDRFSLIREKLEE